MIGIFGGTFDPVHLGHLRPVLEVQQQLELQQVRLVPCRLPPHRDKPIASAMHRHGMLELALAGQPGLVIDDRELEREGPSYMVDTLESLRQEMDKTPLCLILGMDAFLGLPSWHQWVRLAEYAHLVVMTRPGWSISEAGELSEFVMKRKVLAHQQLCDAQAGYVFFCEVTQLEISASKIRTQIAKGQSVRYLLPDSVLAFIEDEGIYH